MVAGGKPKGPDHIGREQQMQAGVWWKWRIFIAVDTLRQKLQHRFLRGGGEMGELIRSKDWAATPLGELASWPQNLLTTLSILLHSKFPMFLWWGPELFCFYNDAYRPSLGITGKHPSILGERAETAWKEIWTVIKPLIDQVMSGGESVWAEDQLVPIERNGCIEDVYWTFSYSPVPDESGRVAGVLVVCTETTEKINTLKAMSANEEKFRNLVMRSPVPTASFKGPEFVIELANEEVLQLWGKDSSVIGKRLIDAIPELEGQPFIDILQTVYTTGERYEGKENIAYLQKDGGLIKIYIDLIYKPLRDAGGKINGVLAMGYDVTEQVLARERILETEQRFSTLTQIMPQMIWTSDADGNLNYYSPSVYDYSGLSPEELGREGWLSIVHPEDREENLQRWGDAIVTGDDFLIEHRFRRHDGSYRWQLSRAIPQYDNEGRIKMWVGTSTDIDEIKQHERQKDDFIKVASHELKTPITTIKGYVQLLLREEQLNKDPFLLQSLSTIDKQVSKLTKLIGDLLDTTKIEMGSFQLNKTLFPIGELVKDTISNIQATIRTHSFVLHQHADPSIFADRDRVEQVLINLLTNAVKYSPGADRIVVEVNVDDGNLCVSVQDFGIGVAPEDQDKIFSRFYRVSGRDEKTYPGFGIGLFIVREIVTLHGGRVWVESKKGHGSSFYFLLPVL